VKIRACARTWEGTTERRVREVVRAAAAGAGRKEVESESVMVGGLLLPSRGSGDGLSSVFGCSDLLLYPILRDDAYLPEGLVAL
jgi:hypothetical protein